MEKTHRYIKNTLIFFIRLYQFCLSPFLGASCRFYPTCSQYCIEALYTYGVLKGSWLAMKRLSRCHPWHEGGVDEVPMKDR